MLADWHILVENDEGQYFPTMSPCMIWPEAVAYQSSFEGDFKRVMFDQRALYNLSISPVKGFKGDKLARLRGVLVFMNMERLYGTSGVSGTSLKMN